MNTIDTNTNNEGIKYLTFEEVKKRYKVRPFHVYEYQFQHVYYYYANSTIFWKLLDEVPDEYIKFTKDYMDFFDENYPDRHKLLNLLFNVYLWDIVRVQYPSDERPHKLNINEKMELLNKTLNNIFKLLPDPNLTLNQLFYYEDVTGKRAIDIFLNEREFYNFLRVHNYLLDVSEIEKYNKKTKQILKDFFPNVNTGR